MRAVLIAALMLTAALLHACESDDAQPSAAQMLPTQMLPTEGSAQAGQGASEMQPSDAGAFGVIECDPAGDGVCETDGDCPLIESGEAREWAATCGTSCLGIMDEAGCARSCLQAQTTLSDDCSECYVQMAVCSRELCLVQCLNEPESRECFDCQVQGGCRATFDDCSGLPPASEL